MQRRNTIQRLGIFIFTASLILMVGAAKAGEPDNPYIGHWALTIPGGGAGWLGVTETHDKLSAAILWGGGSVLPVDTIKVEGDKLVIERFHGKGKDRFAELITARLHGDDNLKLTWSKFTTPDIALF